jgi:hypothetical protein
VEWDKVRRVALWDKVARLLREPQLRPLVKQEWVTVRNALSHKRALINPRDGTIEFSDLKRKITWSIDEARLEAMGMFLANCAMIRTPNFVLAEQIKPFSKLADLFDRSS